jgi:glycosyltransferase involved in cell wall biosynthesis
MKVGVYIGDVTPESGGGYTFISEILEQLRARAGPTSHRFTILTTHSAPVRSGDFEVISAPALPRGALNVRRKIARGAARLLGRPSMPFFGPDPRIERQLAAAGLDVIWYLQPADWWTLDIPYITTVWDLQHRLQPFFPEVSAGREFHNRDNTYAPLLRRAALVVAGTEVGSEEIQRFFGVARERILTLPHPTPSFVLAAADQPRAPRLARAPADPYLFYPAQFWPHKNHVNLLEALRILRERERLPFSLVLTGADKGNEAFVRETATRLGVADAVAMLGFVSREELVALYQHAFALTYVTFFGPENLPPLEAFALGCPVVASDVSGAREQLGDAALRVDPRKPEEIAAAITRLHADPAARAALVERGRTRARRFTGADFVAGILAWLDEFALVRRCWPSGGG